MNSLVGGHRFQSFGTLKLINCTVASAVIPVASWVLSSARGVAPGKVHATY